MRTTTLAGLLFLMATGARAQATPTWLEDGLYGGGKMNAVAVVVAIIVLGIGLWLWAQDRRLRALERRMEDKHDQHKGT